MISDKKKEIFHSILEYLNSIDDNKNIDWNDSKIKMKDMNSYIVNFLNENNIQTETGKAFTAERWGQFKHMIRKEECAWKAHLAEEYEDKEFIYWEGDNWEQSSKQNMHRGNLHSYSRSNLGMKVI